MEAIMDTPQRRPVDLIRVRPGRIVLTGPECTGKTTLARQLAETLDTLWVPEYARAYAVRRATLSADDVSPIARGQIAGEEDALQRLRLMREAIPGSGGTELLVLDTDLVSTVVYARHYYGSCPDWIVDAARQRLGSLYLLADIDVPWTADGIRDQPSARAEIHAAFQCQLIDFGARVVAIRGLGAARVTSAVRAAVTFVREAS
jgi:nicotinamide riboside kinase